MLKRNFPPSTSKIDYIALRGGLDQVTPTQQLRPGFVRDAVNFEQSVSGGYRRIEGYERFDGRTSPSEGEYTLVGMAFYSGVGTVIDREFVYGTVGTGQAIVGRTSGATATVVATLAWPGGTGINPIAAVLINVAGSFVEGETIDYTPGVTAGRLESLSPASTDPAFYVTSQACAAFYYRSLIAAVPGQGAVLGVFYYGGTTYAMRRAAAGTALSLYKSTTSGWTLVPYVNEIGFTTGTAAYTEGSTLSKGGASATVRRVVLESGTWAAGTAAGRLIIGTVTGGPFTAGVAGGGGVATLTGAQDAITLTAAGVERVETDAYSFGLGSRVYGADAVNRHWEFDGTYLVPISTPVPGLFPSRVLGHQGHLFFAIESSLFCSGIGLPYSSAAIDGAAEILAPSAITSLKRLPGDQTTGAMMVGCEDTAQILYGTSAADFKLASYEDASGVKAHTAQAIGGQAFALSDLGVFVLGTSLQYGNFASNTVTAQILPWIQARRNSATASLVNREKGQYRVFFSDGSALYCTFAGGKLIGAMPIQFEAAVNCACSGEAPNGTETAFFGGTDGLVYRLDSGAGCDSAAMFYMLTFAWASERSPRVLKRYRRASFEAQGESYATMDLTYSLGYGSDHIAQDEAAEVAPLTLTSPTWDEGQWDVGSWDAVALRPVECELSGTGESISITVQGSDSRFSSFTLNSLAVHYSPRRQIR